MKYYSIHRPIAPGTFPRPEGNKVIAIGNFPGRLYMDDIEMEAWGWIEYAEPLSEKDAAAYELIPWPTN